MVSPVPTGPHPKLPQLLDRISGQSLILQQMDRYYTGTQPLSFLAPEVQRAVQNRLRSLVINWPRLVVNSLEERLDVDGFRLSGAQGPNDDLWAIWQANNLDEASQMCHIDTLVHGRAFAIVWADPANPDVPKISVESAENMSVEFEPGTTNVVAAVKHWAQDDMAYANLYLDDVVYCYQAQTVVGGYVPGAAAWEQVAVLPHDLGVCPVVAFLNRPRLTHPYGESELTDVIPLVDAINKLATDMMVSAEYHAMPRRWATGIQMDTNNPDGSPSHVVELVKKNWTDAASGRVWLTDSTDVKFGQFPEAALDNFVKGIEMLAAQVAAISGLPPHYVGLMSQANPASAEAIESAETSMNHRAKRKMRVLGGAWEQVMRLALLVRDGTIASAASSMETIWRKPETPSPAQMVDAAVKADSIGMPFRQNLEELGYTPQAAERIIDMRGDDALALVLKQIEAADKIVESSGISRAAALSAVGLEEAAKVEAIVEARAPGPGVVTLAELAAEVAAATPVVPAGVPVEPSVAADPAIKPPVA